nr:hypothetical protein [Streptomyces erythrochromogenes]
MVLDDPPQQAGELLALRRRQRRQEFVLGRVEDLLQPAQPPPAERGEGDGVAPAVLGIGGRSTSSRSASSLMTATRSLRWMPVRSLSAAWLAGPDSSRATMAA